MAGDPILGPLLGLMSTLLGMIHLLSTMCLLLSVLVLCLLALLLPLLFAYGKLVKKAKSLGSKDDDVSVGVFHPYCDAGGGGERVLWVAIKAMANR